MTAVASSPDLGPARLAAYEALLQRDDGLARLVARDGTPDPFFWGVLEHATGGDAFAELVHGAYADSSSWNGVIEPLTADGHRVIAWASPLRSIVTDAAALSDLVRGIEGRCCSPGTPTAPPS